jgi:hypothetical protein
LNAVLDEGDNTRASTDMNKLNNANSADFVTRGQKTLFMRFAWFCSFRDSGKRDKKFVANKVQ